MTTAIHLAFEPEDAPSADAIAAALEQAGWTPQRAVPGQRAPEQAGALASAVSEARVVVALVSAASARSEAMRHEIQAAWNNGKPVIAAVVGDPGADAWLLGSESVVDLRAEPMERLVEAVGSALKGGAVVAMLNIKGGVGKTVLAANLFAAAHLIDGRSVSFIDLDPQHNLTQYFLPAGERNRLRVSGGTIYSALVGEAESGKSINEIVTSATPLNRARRRVRARFDLVVGDEQLFEFTLDTRSDAQKAEAFGRFRQLVAALRARSDVVVIDANPCATFLTRLAITAATHIVAPVRPETYSLTGLNMLEHVVRAVRGRPLRSAEFSVLLNGVNDRTRAESGGDPDAMTRAEISQAPFFGAALLEEAVPYSGALRSTPADRYAANPINVTAIMRVGGRQVKEALARSAASILKRAGP
ncbi:MAG TPA: AAA family ATPase [Caulobacterales bacterium]|nr:AAA family ATPase [Caulobacterales bacterium]